MAHVHGVGLGFRYEFAEELFATKPAEVGWLEIHPENYIGRGGTFATQLERAREHYSFLTHGLTQCVGTPDPLDRSYLRSLRALLAKLNAPFHSEHLAWGNLGGGFTHDLLPLPFSRAAVRRVCESVAMLRDALEIDIAVENISAYTHVAPTEMREIDFLLEVLDGSEAKLLLDVNNVFVNAQNHGFDAKSFLDRIPADRVVQLHVAGHLLRPDGLRVDTHSEPVLDEVFELVAHVVERIGDVPILLERDGNFPPLGTILPELQRLEAMRTLGLSRRATRKANAVHP